MLQSSQQRMSSIFALSFSQAIKDQIPQQMKDDCECMICRSRYNLQSRVAMNICEQKHICCLECLKLLYKNQGVWPFCKKVMSPVFMKKDLKIQKTLVQAAQKLGIPYEINQHPEKTIPPRIINQPYVPQQLNGINIPLIDADQLSQSEISILPSHHQRPLTPCIQRFSTRVNERLYHGQIRYLMFNVIFFFVFEVVEFNYAGDNNLETSGKCCLNNKDCQNANIKLRSDCFMNALMSFWMLSVVVICSLLKRKSTRYHQSFIMLFMLTYLALTIWVIYSYVIQKLDFLDLKSAFSGRYQSGDDLQTCMGSYYGYFAYVTYGFGFWIGIWLLFIICRVVANQ